VIVGLRHLNVLLPRRIKHTLGWLAHAVAMGGHERLGADCGEKGHQEEHLYMGNGCVK